ncbi:phosphoenolpyruvate carboxykinase (GTP) [bacterium]|nr:phosphoenolpyruvate carboxykinase (GTP) [candidate division CSSED10-310 bacterium]
MDAREVLRNNLSTEELAKLTAVDNPDLHEFVATYIMLCEPERVFVCTDSDVDLQRIRKFALDTGEERTLAVPNHTIHFDGYNDQARDKGHTKFLVPRGVDLGAGLNTMDKEDGLAEIHGIMRGIMHGHTMYVRFFCLGPTRSPFSIPTVQLTDSAYVAHSLDLLYRQGYEEFKRLGRTARWFKIVHSQGELSGGVSKNTHLRRVYIDTFDSTVYSTNTQYGGNTLGLKKLAMRLAIHRADQEGWLCEHMFLMGVNGPGDRVTYFTGAFPSMCGKTSTSMITGERIVGDDIVYMRRMDDGIRAVNVERGMFGIIMGINSVDDPLIWKALHEPNEIIFSNILVTEDNRVYWLGKDGEMPETGINHSGTWHQGKMDAKGNEIPPSHKNARFTIRLSDLDNVDERLHDPAGCPIGGVIYGGRDSEAWVPVIQAFDWNHGIATIAAALESETTAATLGQEGLRTFNPMSNLDFVSIPLGTYIKNNLEFGADLATPPLVFGVNYFLRDRRGNFLNAKTDKAIWLKWMELRCHGEVDAITTPMGFIPIYADLTRLFKTIQDKHYSREDYISQFSIRVPENLAKLDRITASYRTKAPDSPARLFAELDAQRLRLEAAREEFGDYIEPDALRQRPIG